MGTSANADRLKLIFRIRAESRAREAECHDDFMKMADAFDEMEAQRDAFSAAMARGVLAIDACMMEMSRNGDSISVRESADAARELLKACIAEAGAT